MDSDEDVQRAAASDELLIEIQIGDGQYKLIDRDDQAAGRTIIPLLGIADDEPIQDAFAEQVATLEKEAAEKAKLLEEAKAAGESTAQALDEQHSRVQEMRSQRDEAERKAEAQARDAEYALAEAASAAAERDTAKGEAADASAARASANRMTWAVSMVLVAIIGGAAAIGGHATLPDAWKDWARWAVPIAVVVMVWAAAGVHLGKRLSLGEWTPVKRLRSALPWVTGFCIFGVAAGVVAGLLMNATNVR